MLNFILSCLLSLSPGTAWFTSSSAYAGTGANDATVGTLTWSNPSFATGSPDNNVTDVTTNSYGTTKYLKVTNFGFSLPGGVSITGCQVAIKRAYWIDITTKDSAIKLVLADGSIGSTNKSTGATWPLSPTASGASTTTFGGSSDNWGGDANTDWNDVDTGVVISADMSTGTTNSTTAFVDSVQVTLTYNVAPSMPRRTIVSKLRKIQESEERPVIAFYGR